ncbi:MAG: leucine-rich repeat domain-containing protein, partial [Clostridia bacterium]|nr:leucine-rich repeat domain-containing protein [Clostridia bacterium]
MLRVAGIVLCALLVCIVCTALAEQVSVDGMVYELENGVAYAVHSEEGADEVVVHEDIRGFSVSFERMETFIDTSRLVVAEGITKASNEWYIWSSAETLVLPSTLREIEGNAFAFMDNLRELVIPEGVERINDWAFSGGLRTVTLPSTLVWIGEYAFWDCPYLEAFVVHPDNPFFTAIDGVLFSKDLRELLFFPSVYGSSWTVPDETVTIVSGAFRYNESLRSLTLGAGIASIDDY